MEEFVGGREQSLVLTVIVIVPFLGSIVAFFLTRLNKKFGEYFTAALIAVLFTAIFSLYWTVKEGIVVFSRFQFLALPLSIDFRMDMLGFFMALLISLLWLLATFHSMGYMAKEHAHDRYYCFYLLALGGCLGTVLAGDLVGLFLFFEIMAVSSYVLVAHEENSYAMFAGAKYLFMSVGAGLAIFFGLILTYYLSGTVSLDGFGIINEATPLSFYAFLAFLIGFGVKAGIFPVHVWLPDAHPAAPSPVSALLSGLMIKVGAYGVIRVFYQVYGFELLRTAGWEQIILVISVITILLGSALALLQDDLKRRLAYSSIAQIGYIFLGLSLISEHAFTGAIYHIFTHAFMKGCLFLIAGIIIVRTGERLISRMGGIGFQMPLTMIAFTLCSMSMVGIPPFNGFISKWQLSLGALDIGEPFYVVLLIVSSLLNAAYYFPIVVAAFFATGAEEHAASHGGHASHAAEEHEDEHEEHEEGEPFLGNQPEAPLNMLIPVSFLAIGTIAFAIMPQNPFLELAKAVVRELFVSF